MCTAALMLFAGLPALASAQSIRTAVKGVGEGTVHATFATRPGVEVCSEGIRMGEHRIWWRSRHGDQDATQCREGSLEVELRVRAGLVQDVRVLRAAEPGAPDALDVGEIPARDAADYLLAVARGGEGGHPVEEAILPAVLADVKDVWKDLLEIARDRTAARPVRKTALFWVGQEAAQVATEGLARIARDHDEDQEVRDAAVFALSQRPEEEGVPILMEIARTAEDAQTRKTALFWLAQAEDARVPAFFEQILLRGIGG